MPLIWPRNDVAGCGAVVGVALGVVGVLEVDVDEQAVAARPNPTMTVKIVERRNDFTVPPSPEGARRLPYSGRMRASSRLSVSGRQHRPPAVPTHSHVQVGGTVQSPDEAP